jgi:hypothetical protein
LLGEGAVGRARSQEGAMIPQRHQLTVFQKRDAIGVANRA